MSAIELDYGIANIYPPIDTGGESITLSQAATEIYLEQQKQSRSSGLAFLQDLARQAEAVVVVTEVSQQLGNRGRSICDVVKKYMT